MNTGYEIDYLPVGDGERCGDAIAIRYGNLTGPRSEQTVITIDGGTVESGKALVEHVKKHYGTDRVDLAILSHPDTDHASGMREVVENLKGGVVAMHLPWNHSADVKALLDDNRVTAGSLKEKAKKNLTAAREVETIARQKGWEIAEPFAGAHNNNGLIVLGPTKEFYQQQLSGFKFMPGAESAVANFLHFFKEAAAKLIPESWLSETLKEPAADATSPENNSSVIFLLTVDGKQLLFTGDAGVPALHAALDYAHVGGISLNAVQFFDVPHHGSRKNIGPSVLNRIFGGMRPQTSPKTWTAFVSCAKEASHKHPHKKVTNALIRRGANVCWTKGQSILHFFNAPARAGYDTIQPLPFHNNVEDDD